jgi:hypothetical protein
MEQTPQRSKGKRGRERRSTERISMKFGIVSLRENLSHAIVFGSYRLNITPTL